MAWVQGECAAAAVTLYPNRQIKFNNTAYVMLGDGAPGCVGVFYNSTANRLGFRRDTCGDSIRVLFTDDMKFFIDAVELMENLGVVIAEEVTLPLNAPAPPTQTTLGDQGIYWVQLP